MTTITKNTLGTMFTAAQINSLCGFRSKRRWRKWGVLMTAIAKWLILTLATRTPVVGLTGGNFNCVRRFLSNMGFHYVTFN